MFRGTIALLALAAVAIEGRNLRATGMKYRDMVRAGMTNNPGGKIVGGSEVPPHSLVYQVSFQDSNSNFHFCGGSIYTEEWVICAAHCVAGEDFDNPQNLAVVAGVHNLFVEESSWQPRVVDRIIQHENYNQGTQFGNDVSMLHVSQNFDFSAAEVGPIALDTRQDVADEDILVSGWGTLTPGGQSPDQLHCTKAALVTDEVCRSQYGESDIDDSMLCAGTGGHDACQGDSGGPLVTFTRDDDPSTFRLAGIVSWGRSCALPDFAGVYAEVSYFVDWIEAQTGTKA